MTDGGNLLLMCRSGGSVNIFSALELRNTLQILYFLDLSLKKYSVSLLFSNCLLYESKHYQWYLDASAASEKCCATVQCYSAAVFYCVYLH